MRFRALIVWFIFFFLISYVYSLGKAEGPGKLIIPDAYVAWALGIILGLLPVVIARLVIAKRRPPPDDTN